MPQLIPLGINGYHPMHGRHSAAYLLLYDDAAILLDAGSGVARMTDPVLAARLRDYRELHIVLSHYHLDHVIGLYFLYTAFPGRTRIIHAPARPFIDCDPHEALGRLFTPPLNSFSLEDNLCRVEPRGEAEYRIGRHRIRLWPQRHPGNSAGIRVDDDVAYCSDTVVMPENAVHVRGVQLLMHELWITDEEAAADEAERNRHACFSPVADFIRAAAPRAAMPIHWLPSRSDGEIRALCDGLARRAGVPVVEPVEGRPISIG